MTDDPVTPELALVDPELRRRLLADAPPDPVPRLRQGGGSSAFALPVEIPTRTEPGDGRPSYRGRLTGPLVVAACSSLLTLGIGAAVLELRPDHRSSGASHAAIGPPATTTRSATGVSATTTARRPPKAPAAPHELRFSWAAVAGATSYDVAFYAHGVHDRLVLELTTQTPTAVVKVLKTGSKAAHALAPGPYRWYVWPVRATGRDSVAVVRSTLTVS